MNTSAIDVDCPCCQAKKGQECFGISQYCMGRILEAAKTTKEANLAAKAAVTPWLR